MVALQPRARPADALTSAAIPGRVAALDIGVTSPAASSGEDAADAMFRRKVQEREGIRNELDHQNIEYRPMVWTHFGRLHEAAVDVIRSIARIVARRRGNMKPSIIERKIRTAVSVCIARRAARMSLACWPSGMREGAAEAATLAAMERFEEDETMAEATSGPDDTDGPVLS